MTVASSDLIEPRTQPATFLDELYRYRDVLKRYNLRYHLARYPKDLLAIWWRKEGCLPHPTSKIAFESFRRGEKPGRLYQGPPHRTQLKLIEGGKT